MKKRSEGFEVASTGDCTGLIPSLPQNEEEIESYEEMYPFLPPEASIKGASKKKED